MWHSATCAQLWKTTTLVPCGNNGKTACEESTARRSWSAPALSCTHSHLSALLSEQSWKPCYESFVIRCINISDDRKRKPQNGRKSGSKEYDKPLLILESDERISTAGHLNKTRIGRELFCMSYKSVPPLDKTDVTANDSRGSASSSS